MNMARPKPALHPEGLLRLDDIVGNPAKKIPALLPICPSSWWNGVKAGKYPQPVKLSARTTCWRVRDVLKLIEEGDPAALPSPPQRRRRPATCGEGATA